MAPPSPSHRQLSHTPTRSADLASHTSSYPATPEDGVGNELSLPVLPGTRYTFQDPYAIRYSQSMDEYRDCFPDDASERSAHSTGILEDAKKGLCALQIQHDEENFSFYGCSDVFPLSLFGANEDRMIKRSASVPIPSDSSIVSASAGSPSIRRRQSEGREYDGHPPGIDFATGLSGHAGLNRTPRSGKNGNRTPHRQVRLMSDHRGASHVRLSSVHAVTSW